MKKIRILAVGMAAALCLSGCGTEVSLDNAEATTQAFDLSFSQRDKQTDYTNETLVELGSEALTITKAGTYLLRGATERTVRIEAGKEDKIQLILDGVDIRSAAGPALVIESADKVFLTLAEGSDNHMEDAVGADDSEDGVIFSREDLTVNGSGSLTINGTVKHGIVSKDDLVITGGVLSVEAPSTGIDGKDCVKLTDAAVSIKAGTNGIRSDNDEDKNRGFIYIAGGAVKIDAAGDGIQAASLLCVEGGEVNVVSGGGSENAPQHFDGNQRFGNWSEPQTEDSGSAKGLKSDGALLISGGSVTVDSADDSLHSNTEIEITGGTLCLKSGDDGIHADEAVRIAGGNVTITESYEGIESAKLEIAGGWIDVTASDDGLNASDGSGDGFGRGGQNASILLSGGYTVVDAGGDGIDSNGTVEISGGITLVSGPTDNGNTALDYESSAKVTGGVLVALGSAGMAEGFTSAEHQGAILTTFERQRGGTSFALTDSTGKAVVLFTPAKDYECAAVTAPGLKAGETYTVIAGASASQTDEHGYAENVTVEGGTTLTTVELTELVYGSGMGGFGGHGGRQDGAEGFGGRPGGAEGFGGRPDDGFSDRGEGDRPDRGDGGFGGHGDKGTGDNGEPPEGFNGQPGEPPEGFNGQPGEPPEGFDGQPGEPPEGFNGQPGEPPEGFDGQPGEPPEGFNGQPGEPPQGDSADGTDRPEFM